MPDRYFETRGRKIRFPESDTKMLACGVIIPAYQAVTTIGDVVRQCRACTQVRGVLVVDDGSTDGTGDAAREGGAVVITHPVNRGKGAALLTGFAAATTSGWEAAITLDADGQHDPRSIPDFIAEHERSGADIIVGTRARRGTKMPLPRRISNRLSSAVVSHLAGVRIPDSQSGYRLITRRVWETISLRSVHYDMESEVLIKAARRGYLITSVPVETRYGNERSHFHPWRDTARMVHLFWTAFQRSDEAE